MATARQREAESEDGMCVACGQELCKSCHECHNEECECYIAPSDTCEITQDTLWFGLTTDGPEMRANHRLE